MEIHTISGTTSTPNPYHSPAKERMKVKNLSENKNVNRAL